MADNKVRKGFTTYLVIFLMMILAAFLIVIVVMLFSPFKNILGFQYMIYNVDERHYKTSADETIDFSNLDEININCNSAQVLVQRFYNIDEDAIRIENYCKGFAKSSDNTDFSYEIYFADEENKILNIDVQEPEGFLFFNKEVSISILVPAKAAYALANTKVNITNTSGDIFIGNPAKLSENEDETGVKTEVDVNDINIKTKTGDILFYPFVENNFGEIFIKTDSGDISTQLDTINVNKRFELHTATGEFKLDSIVFNGTADPEKANIVLDLNNSQFSADYIKGVVELNMAKGYLDLVNLEGSLNANDSIVQMKEATINIDNINGNVSLPYVNESNVNIGKMSSGSQIYVKATSGNVNISEMSGKAYIETTSGDVNVHTYADDLDIETTSGNIDVIYESPEIQNEVKLTSVSGDINVQVLSQLKFVIKFFDTNGEYRTSSNIAVEFQDSKFTNPLIVNNGTKPMVLTSNERIYVGII